MCGGSQKTSSRSTFKPSDIASGIYNQAITGAQQVAQTPYDPATESAVAGFTPDQLAAFQQVDDAQGAWSPYFDQAAQFATQAAGPISQDAISGYMDPYIQQVIDATLAQTNRQDQIEQARLRGNAVAGGALGGNAPAVNSAVLAGEQGRNRNSLIAGLLSGGYTQALNAAQQDALRQQTSAGQLGQLGGQTQQALYNDVMARLSAGNQQQAQQQQVLNTDTANAQQRFLFPYQNTQWLSSIGGALGPLTGGTTSGTGKTKQGKGIGNVIGAGLSTVASLSDRRAKKDVTRVGFTDDGQPVYKFRYRGSPKFQIGLMADEVEKSHPEAVGEGPYGMKMVDYDQATNFADGGGVFGGKTLMPWAPLSSPSAQQPSLPSAPQGQSGNDYFSDPIKALDLGKSANKGFSDIFRAFDPAGGWGASIEPISGGGSFLDSLFGFASGGRLPEETSLKLADLIASDMPSLWDGDGADEIYDNFAPFRNGVVLRPEGGDELVNPDPTIPALQIGGDKNAGFASGGIVSPYQTLIEEPESRRMDIPEGAPIISPYGTQPGDDFIGEVGPSGIEDIGEVGESGINPELPWYRQSLTDMLGITEGRTDPSARLSFPKLENREPEPPETGPQPSWSIDNGTIRYGGKSFADWIAGTQPEAPVSSPYDNPDMIVDRPEFVDQYGPGGVQASAETSVPVETSGAFDFIKQQEGFTPKAKWDRRQYSSGYGTRAEANETIDREEAERRLQSEVGKVEQWLNENITVEMSPAQRTGLTSFGYNLGVDDLDKLKSDINAGDWGRVAGRMKTFNKARNDKTGQLEPLQGLTDRRIREAALVSGGAALPAEIQTLSGEMNHVAAKGYAKTDQPAEAKYRDSTDRQTGGLLKRWFGFDFNPLQLSEDERTAMLVAGLSMMSHGDVGKGGLAGLSYLQNKQAVDRKTALDMAKLAWDQRKEGNKNLIELLKIEGAQNKPTDDIREYLFAQSNDGFTGSFTDFMRTKKSASSSQLPAEMAARIGLGRAFQASVPGIKDAIRKFTPGDRVDLQLGRGKAAQVWREIESGREALVRSLTGAGMNIEEATNQVKRYQIEATDKVETMLQKLDLLVRDLQATEAGAIQGKTGTLAEQYRTNTSAPRPMARNAAGDLIQWNGAAWVPVSPTGMGAVQ